MEPYRVFIVVGNEEHRNRPEVWYLVRIREAILTFTKHDKFFKRQGVCFLIDVCHSSKKFCVVVDRHSKDRVLFQTFSTVRVVLIIWKQICWHQYFVQLMEKPITSLIRTMFYFVTGAFWFSFSFLFCFVFCTGISPLKISLCWASFMICTIKILPKSLNV